MMSIFLSYAPQDATCAESLRQSLETAGYSVWREPTSLDLSAVIHPRTIEDVMLGSAVLVLLWSSHATQTQEVQQHLLFVQRLKKLIVPVALDSTPLPPDLLTLPSVTRQISCADLRTALLPLLPSAQQSDPLQTLYEQASSDLIRVRKEAIDEAAAMLQRGEHRESVLALLEYKAHNDLMMSVRERAQEMLNAERTKSMPKSAASQPDYIFSATCPNGHMAYFDKRYYCKADRTADRIAMLGMKQPTKDKQDAILLTCNVCHEEFIEYVDCEGYR